MPAVIELPTLDALRDEQRSLRAQLARLRRRLHLQLVLELATDAAIVLTATAALLVFLDWLFRFGLPVRWSCSALRVWGFWRSWAFARTGGGDTSRLDELSLAVTLDRYRPGVGQQIADVLQLPDLLAEPGVGLAGHGPAGRSSGLRGAGRFRLAIALEPEADGPARRGACCWA